MSTCPASNCIPTIPPNRAIRRRSVAPSLSHSPSSAHNVQGSQAIASYDNVEAFGGKDALDQSLAGQIIFNV